MDVQGGAGIELAGEQPGEARAAGTGFTGDGDEGRSDRPGFNRMFSAPFTTDVGVGLFEELPILLRGEGYEADDVCWFEPVVGTALGPLFSKAQPVIAIETVGRVARAATSSLQGNVSTSAP